MTDGMFCAHCLSQYQEILSKTRLFGTRNCSKLGRSLYNQCNMIAKITRCENLVIFAIILNALHSRDFYPALGEITWVR